MSNSPLLVGRCHEATIHLLRLYSCGYWRKLFSVRMCGTKFDGLSQTLAYKNERSSILVSAMKGAEKLLKVMVQGVDLLLRLNHYKMSKENFVTLAIGTRHYFEGDNGADEAPAKEVEIDRE